MVVVVVVVVMVWVVVVVVVIEVMVCLNEKEICNIPTSTCCADRTEDNDVRIIKIELKVFPISES